MAPTIALTLAAALATVHSSELHPTSAPSIVRLRGGYKPVVAAPTLSRGALTTPAKGDLVASGQGGFDVALFLYFAGWYLGNYYYTLNNKYALNAAGGGTGFPVTIGFLQMCIGSIYALFLWTAPDARVFPQITASDLTKIVPVAACAAGAHLSSIFSMNLGAVSFAQIVKAAEPAFAALLGVTLYGKTVSRAKWLCLIPVIGGVCLASLKELDFSVLALFSACVANLFAAFRSNENKKLMDTPGLSDRIGSTGNQFAISTILGMLCLLPIWVATEASKFGKVRTPQFGPSSSSPPAPPHTWLSSPASSIGCSPCACAISSWRFSRNPRCCSTTSSRLASTSTCTTSSPRLPLRRRRRLRSPLLTPPSALSSSSASPSRSASLSSRSSFSAARFALAVCSSTLSSIKLAPAAEPRKLQVAVLVMPCFSLLSHTRSHTFGWPSSPIEPKHTAEVRCAASAWHILYARMLPSRVLWGAPARSCGEESCTWRSLRSGLRGSGEIAARPGWAGALTS